MPKVVQKAFGRGKEFPSTPIHEFSLISTSILPTCFYSPLARGIVFAQELSFIQVLPPKHQSIAAIAAHPRSAMVIHGQRAEPPNAVINSSQLLCKERDKSCCLALARSQEQSTGYASSDEATLPKTPNATSRALLHDSSTSPENYTPGYVMCKPCSLSVPELELSRCSKLLSNSV